MELTQDTGAAENQPPHPNDPNQIASGSAQSPGGEDASEQSASEMTQGGEGYPGPRAGGENDK